MPRKLYARRKRRTAGDIAKSAALALFAGAAVYFLLAGGLGTYIARNYIIPNMQGVGGTPEVPPPDTLAPQNTQNGGVTTTPAPVTPAPAIVTDIIDLPAAAFWSVQLGSFGNYDNAASLSQSLRERGAAGYIYTDKQGHYRVLASAYAQYNDALSVQRQLLSEQGLESYLLEIAQEGARLQIQAADTDIAYVKEAYAAWVSVREALPPLYYAVDRGEITPSEAAETLTGYIDVLRGAAAALPSKDALGGSGGMAITGLASMISQTADNLAQLGQNAQNTPVSMSSGIKYNYIDCLQLYINYVQSLLGGGV